MDSHCTGITPEPEQRWQRAHKEGLRDSPVHSQAVRRCSKETSWSQALPPAVFQRVPASRGRPRLALREAGSTGGFGCCHLLLRFTGGRVSPSRAKRDAGEGSHGSTGHQTTNPPVLRSPATGGRAARRSASCSHRAQPSPARARRRARASRTRPWHRAPAAKAAPARSSPGAQGTSAGSRRAERPDPPPPRRSKLGGAGNGARSASPLRPRCPRAAPAPHRPAPAAPRGPGRSRRSRRGVAGPPAAASPAPARCRGCSRSAAPSLPAPPPSPPAAGPAGRCGAGRGGTGRAPPPRAARPAGAPAASGPPVWCFLPVYNLAQSHQARPRSRVPAGPGVPAGRSGASRSRAPRGLEGTPASSRGWVRGRRLQHLRHGNVVCPLGGWTGGTVGGWRNPIIDPADQEVPAPSRLVLPPAPECIRRAFSLRCNRAGKEAAGWGRRGWGVIFLVVGCQGPGSTAGPKEWKGVKQRKGLMASRGGRKEEAERDCQRQLGTMSGADLHVPALLPAWRRVLMFYLQLLCGKPDAQTTLKSHYGECRTRSSAVK